MQFDDFFKPKNERFLITLFTINKKVSQSHANLFYVASNDIKSRYFSGFGAISSIPSYEVQDPDRKLQPRYADENVNHKNKNPLQVSQLFLFDLTTFNRISE